MPDNTPDAVARYDAFLSYSHKDKQLAARLQRALERLYHRLPPRYRRGRGPLRVLRDETDFDLTADLRGYIRTQVHKSESLVVLATRFSVGSDWVNDVEIPAHLERDGDGVRLAVVIGEPLGDPTPLIPRALTSTGRAPLVAGLLEPKGERFDEQALLRVLSRVLGVPVAELLGRHAQYRRRVLGARIVASVAAVAVLLSTAWIAWDLYRMEAAAQLARRAVDQLGTDSFTARALARRAWNTDEGVETYAALFRAAHTWPTPAAPTLELSSSPRQLAFNSGGWLGVADDVVSIYDDRLVKKLQLDTRDEHSMNGPIVAPFSEGRWLTAQDKAVYLWNSQGAQLARLQLDREVESIDVSWSGKMVVVAGTQRLVFWQPDADEASWTEFESALVSHRFLAQSEQFTAVYADGTLHLWANGGILARARASGRINRASSVAGGRTVTLTATGHVEVWNPALQRIGEFSIGVMDAPDITLSPDGQEVFIGRDGWPFALTDITGRLRSLQNSDSLYIQSYSDDGRWLLASNASSRPMLWGASLRLGVRLPEHRGQISMAAFSADSSRLVTASHGRQLRLWDLSPLRDRRRYLDPAYISRIECSRDCDCTIWGHDTLTRWSPRGGFQESTVGEDHAAARRRRDHPVRHLCSESEPDLWSHHFDVGSFVIEETGSSRWLYRPEAQECKPIPVSAGVDSAAPGPAGLEESIWLGGRDGNLYFIDSKTMIVHAVMPAHHQGVTAMASCPGRLLTGGEDGVAAIWTTEPAVML